MVRSLIVVCLAVGARGQLNGRQEPDEATVNVFAENNVEKLFNHYDKDHDGKLDQKEQDKFLDGLQDSYGVDLPADFIQKAKADHAYTLKEFGDVYSSMTEDFNKVQSDTITKQVQAIVEELKNEQEVVNLISTNDADKLFDHYDKDGNGKLTPAEQDDFLNDLEKVSAVDLPASFKAKAKKEHGMDRAEFKKTYTSLTQEFQQIQTDAIKDEMKKSLKAEFTSMLTDYDKDGDGKLSAAEQDKFLDDLQKIYAIDLPAEFQRQATTEDAAQDEDYADDEQDQDAARDMDEVDLSEDAYDAPQASSSLSTDVVTFFVAAITSAALTTLGFHVFRKFRSAPKSQDDYLILSA